MKLKHILLSISLLLGLAASAQSVVGSWEIIPSFGGTPQRVIDTKERVYVVSQNNLSTLDKATEEVRSYDVTNALSDSKITDVWYDYSKRCLVIVYDNFNIDVMFESGKVLNFPELMNAPISASKIVNNVTFHGDKAFVCGEFGLITLDTKKNLVENSVLMPNIKALTVADGKLFITGRLSDDGGQGTRWASLDGPMRTMQDFTVSSGSLYSSDLRTLTDNLWVGNNGTLQLITYNPDTRHETPKAVSGAGGLGSNRFSVAGDGYMIQSYTNKKVHFVDKEGKVTSYDVPAAIAAYPMSCFSGDPKEVWVGLPVGLAVWNLETGTEVRSGIRPEGISGPNVGNVARAADGSIYFMTLGIGNSMSYKGNAYLDKLSGNSMRNIILTPAISWAYTLAVDPVASDKMLVGGFSGFYRVNQDGTYTTYNNENSPLSKEAGAYMVSGIAADKAGNVWTLQNTSEMSGVNDLTFIPKGAWDDTSRWQQFDVGEVGSHHAKLLAHSSGLLLYTAPSKIGVFDPSTQKYRLANATVDEDGLTASGAYIFNMAEDQNGWVWLATMGGVRVVRKPSEIFNTGFGVYRPRVARNDGTNLADFLLDGVAVTYVSVDANNFKWFATNGSGVYKTNPEGTQILEHFTTDNSDLISNTVYAVYADPESNDVYVGTDIGLCVYHSTSAPAADDYSEVYAFPNPVTPDYTGWITITGLMDNSLVKIADSAGRVFHTATSDGGMVVWDGCDASGNRVKSGVYFVYASQSANGSTSGCVTKILVVN